mmetsp:Transcript_3264/g.11865  ORF Transcript_3264/g.11865 Transcript_3264/m.11865 type:complete len:210 (+) Transcript_3264:579-1208(+)
MDTLGPFRPPHGVHPAVAATGQDQRGLARELPSVPEPQVLRPDTAVVPPEGILLDAIIAIIPLLLDAPLGPLGPGAQPRGGRGDHLGSSTCWKDAKHTGLQHCLVRALLLTGGAYPSGGHRLDVGHHPAIQLQPLRPVHQPHCVHQPARRWAVQGQSKHRGDDDVEQDLLRAALRQHTLFAVLIQGQGEAEAHGPSEPSPPEYDPFPPS